MKKVKILLIILALILLLIISYISVLEILSVNRTIDEFNNKFVTEEVKSDIEYLSTSDSTVMDNQFRLAYLSSQLIAAKSDSIILLLNFPDSTADLMIKGVVVHSARIETYKLSRFIDAVDQLALLKMLSTPLQVTKHKSTIRKVPLMVKIAPKDTSEYTPDVVPDTTDIDAVNYIFETNAGIQFYFYESNPKESEDGLKQFKFDLQDRIQRGYLVFKNAATLKKTEYKPEVRIRLNKRDAKIIYRALPSKASIIIKLK